MKLTKKQFRKIEHLMPILRKPPEFSNYQFLCALLYMIENGCKWRALPKKFGKWHTIYMKFNRWSKNGTIQKIFEEMQEMNIIDIRTDTLCIDAQALKFIPTLQVPVNQAKNRVSDTQKGADNKAALMLHVCLLCFCFSPLTGQSPRCAGRPETDRNNILGG